MTITDMTICDLASALRKGELSSLEITRAFLDKIEQNEPSIGAYITVTEDEALREAEEADRRIREKKEVALLTGIPAALKDNIATEGVRTTNASRMLEHFVPPYDAFVTSQLKEDGAVFLGKTNMDEFAMGHSTESSAFHVTRNPYDLSRVPGGSSGGSAAAVAAGEAAYALGTDTGGSICQPAAYCGLVGLRPTYGLVSRRGITSYASSFDQAGPITQTVRDNAAVLDAIAVHDPRDAMASHDSSAPEGGYLQAAETPFGHPVIAYFDTLSNRVGQDVKDALQRVLRFYERLGARVIALSFPYVDEALAAYELITSAEAYSSLNRYDGVHYGRRSPDAESVDDVYLDSRSGALGPEVKNRILLGCFVLAENQYRDYYEKATRVRTLVTRAFADVFSACDAVLAPVAPGVAPLLGARDDDAPDDRYITDRFTVLAPLAGLPALTFPTGLSEEGLPIGLQLLGLRFSEARLYSLATAYEDARGPLPRPDFRRSVPEENA